VCASVCTTCRVEEGFVGSEQVAGSPSRCGLPYGLALTLCAARASGQPYLSAGVANNLEAATQGVSNGH